MIQNELVVISLTIVRQHYYVLEHLKQKIRTYIYRNSIIYLSLLQHKLHEPFHGFFICRIVLLTHRDSDTLSTCISTFNACCLCTYAVTATGLKHAEIWHVQEIPVIHLHFLKNMY